MCRVKIGLSKNIGVRKVYFWVEPKIGITNFLGQRKFPKIYSNLNTTTAAAEIVETLIRTTCIYTC